MALDVGDRRVGVAVSDRLCIIAQGLETFERRGRRVDMAHLGALVSEHEVTRVVIGWPLESSGRAGAQAQKTQRFVDNVVAHTGLPVDKWDERMTTVAAQRVLSEVRGGRGKRQKGTVDKIAATLILQSWLDAHP
jgi:putative Holliday junction resolvase